MIFNEIKQHGTDDFPFGFYQVDGAHPKYEMAFHWHTNLEIVRVLEGELCLTLDNQTHTLIAGDFAIVNSETIHGATPKNCRYECIVFNLAFLKTGNEACDGFLEDILSHNTLLCERPQDREVLILLESIFQTIATQKDGVAFKIIGLFHSLLGELQERGLFSTRHTPTPRYDEKKAVKLKTVLRYLREHFSAPITLEEMAQVAGVSKKYFCKFFKDMTGTTPVAYLVSYRIERAARKLLGSDLTVTQIAFDCGFNDVSYFIKTFKAHKHTSPKEYRTRG